MLRKKFLVAITNPKAVLIFTAFVPQFVDPAHGPPAAALKAVRLTVNARRTMYRGTGVVLLGMAGALAGSGS